MSKIVRYHENVIMFCECGETDVLQYNGSLVKTTSRKDIMNTVEGGKINPSLFVPEPSAAVATTSRPLAGLPLTGCVWPVTLDQAKGGTFSIIRSRPALRRASGSTGQTRSVKGGGPVNAQAAVRKQEAKTSSGVLYPIASWGRKEL